MTNDKEELRDETLLRYLLATAYTGLRRAMATPWLMVIAILVLAVSAAYGLSFVVSAQSYLRVLTLLAVLPLIAFEMTALLFSFGYIRKSWKMYRDFVRIGFTNAAGEAPLLIDRVRERDTQRLVFYGKGLTATDWQEQIAALQSALNMSIAEVRPGYDHRTVIVRAVPANTNLGTVILWTEDLINYDDDADFVLGRSLVGDVHINIDKQPMVLIGGSTGSGKTMLAIVLMVQALLRDARVYVFDGKGLDYNELAVHDAAIYTDYSDFAWRLEDIVSRLRERLEVFRAAGAHDFRDYQSKENNDLCKRIFVLVDECAEVLDPTGRSKEEKEVIARITACLNTIARMGRAVGIHLIISTQRPDANAVPGSIKSNLDVRICGKADPTLSSIILGDGRADELIPKYSQGRFVMADGAQDVIFQGFFYAR